MRILFVPLALLLLALCSFSFSLETAKSEVNRRESAGGMENGPLTWLINSAKSKEKRAVGSPYDFGLKHFKKDKSECKCLRDEYCMKKKSNGKEYENVNGCGMFNCYTLCEAFGCREVCDKQCKCEFGRCEECSDSGCKQVARCGDTDITISRKECQECSQGKGCHKVESSFALCFEENVKAADILFEDKCFCKKDSDGKDKDCQMCDKYRCKPVSSCDRFTQCTCNTADDSYTRCYGYEHGKRECRRVDSCTNAKEHLRRRNVESIVNAHKATIFGGLYDPVKCTCPSYGGFCSMCRHNRPSAWKDNVIYAESTRCEKAHRHECPAGSIQ